MLSSIEIESLRDIDVVVMLSSIEIESLRDIDVVVMLSSIDIESLRNIIFPVRGININRIGNIHIFKLPSKRV
ncbi:MAG: hypothetical protein J5644_01010, partial [Bacteroidales bacterium]|nr:hypothetical protein [Bacteroidales bacterium]